MIPKKELLTGVLYSHNSWDEYWEGELKRRNENIGTVTTQATALTANYGITDRLNVIAIVPYVWTDASQGVLHGTEGWQDFTLAGKFSLLETPFTDYGSIRAIAVLSGSIPLSDYSPDFQPLSIGSASKRVSGRFTLNYQAKLGWFLNGTTSYTWREKVKLDRSSYYTDGKLYLTNEVAMPSVVDYMVSAGYMKGGLMASLFYAEQRTQGGGDIRRQDMPFVSNRMDFSAIGAMVLYPIPKLNNLEFKLEYSHVTDGRNVGQSDTYTTGLLYRFNFAGGAAP